MSQALDEDHTATREESGALDPSSKLIIDEARKRSIDVEILAPRAEYFRLRFGPRAIVCRESLSELTHAVALSICDDKRTTSRLLSGAGLRTPAQVEAKGEMENRAFLRRFGGVVVKPARGEQGLGVSVGIRTIDALSRAVESARAVGTPVLLEELAEGEDLRVIVIDNEVVAAAVRRPPRVVGTGRHTVAELIAAQSRLRESQTSGASTIPIDRETERCVSEAGYTLSDTLPTGKTLTVRKAANVHQGGTIHDVTSCLHPTLRDVSVRAARALDIPVVGLDLIVRSVQGPEYWILEANERPGLANHEPQPTAERFVDFLFPETRVRA